MIRILVYLNILFGLFTYSGFLTLKIGPVNLNLFRLTLLLIIILMILSRFQKKDMKTIQLKKKNYYSILFLLFWFLWALISVIWVKDYSYWVESTTHIILGILLAYIYSKYLNRRMDYVRALNSFVIMVLFHNIIGWYEIITDNYMFYSGVSIYWYQRENMPVSSFGNTNDFATFLFFSITILFVCIVNSTTKIGKLFNIILLLSSLSLMIATDSRGALLSTILSLIIFIIFNKNKKIKAYKILASLLLILMINLTVIIYKPELITMGYNYFVGDFSFTNYLSLNSDDIRIRLIKNGLYFLLRSFGFGVGAGNAQFWLAKESIVDNEGYLYLHNWFLEILVEYGLIVFMMYLMFYFRLFKSMKRIFYTTVNKFDKNFSLSVMVVLIGFIIISHSSHSLVYNEWFWIYWAIVIAYQGNALNNQFEYEK